MEDKKLSKEEVDDILSVNARLNKAVEDIKEVFSNKFYLTQKDLENIIIDIVSKCDEEVAENLSYIFLEFIENDIENFDIKKRRSFAKAAIKNCLDLYNSEVNQIQKDFFAVLKESKKYNIDPFRLAIKENLRRATVNSFNESLQALVFAEYNGIEKDKKEKLFEQSDIKRLFEQCAGLASGVSEKCIQNILNTLSRFVKDEKGNYIVSPKFIVSKCLSLLDYGTPKKIAKLEEMIYFLQENLVPYEMTKRELVLRVADNPSVLLLTPEKVLNVENQLVEAIHKIVKNPGFVGKVDDIDEFALEEAHKFSFNFDNFNEMRGVKQDRIDNLENICDILISNLGADNALKCITNMRILNTDTAVLDCFLTKLAIQEKELNLDLRKFFVENPYRCLNLLEEDDIGIKLAEKMGGHRRTRNIKAQDVPENIKAEDFKKKYNKLASPQKKKVDELSKNILEEIEKDKKARKERQKQNKLEYENMLVEGVLERLSKVKFNTPYAYILSKYKMLLDEKFGNGYAQKTYNIDEYIKYYSDMVDYNQKFADMNEKVIDFADELEKINSTIIGKNANLTEVEAITKEFISKFGDFAKRFITFEKDEFVKCLKEPENRMLTLDNKFGFNAHERIMKNYKEILSYINPSIYMDFTINSSCMRYLEMMTGVMKKEFPDSYETICPEYERENLICQDIPVANKIVTLYNVDQINYGMLMVFEGFLKELKEAGNRIVTGVGGMAVYPDSKKDIGDLKIFDDDSDWRNIQQASQMYSVEQRREIVNRCQKLVNDMFKLQDKTIANGKIKTIYDRIGKQVRDLDLFESESKLYFSTCDLKDTSIKRQSFSILKNDSNKECLSIDSLTKEELKDIDDLPLNNYMAYIIQKYAGVDNKQIEIAKKMSKEK